MTVCYIFPWSYIDGHSTHIIFTQVLADKDGSQYLYLAQRTNTTLWCPAEEQPATCTLVDMIVRTAPTLLICTTWMTALVARDGL